MKTKKYEIAKFILAAIAVTGIIVVAATVPGLFAAFAPFGTSQRRYSDKQIKRTLNKLQANGLISIKHEGRESIIRLSKEGKEKIVKFKLDYMIIKKPDHWDKKWRIVVFDVPVALNFNRYTFVNKLKDLGFLQLQKSVWVCPYPCEDEVDFLKEIYEIGQFVRLITAERIDIESDLIRKFELVKA